MRRRTFLAGTTALAAAGTAAYGYSKYQSVGLQRLSSRKPLQFSAEIDARQNGEFSISAEAGATQFIPNVRSRTLGFNQSYLGPVIRVAAKGTTRAKVSNKLSFPVTTHWHGLIIPGIQDGGPHQLVEPGKIWTPDLTIDQPAAMVWYHSHVAEQTARQVYAGLAGVMLLDDGKDEERGLPVSYGQDDLVLVIQDKRLNNRGEMVYSSNMHDRMTGFVGNTMMVNGQIDPVAKVPNSIVRLRLLNASNAATYSFEFSDKRPFYVVATDSGYLDKPVEMRSLRLAPAERVQLLVDFRSGSDPLLLSSIKPTLIGGGFMGMMMRGRSMIADAFDGQTAVLAFQTDKSLAQKVTTVPDQLDGGIPDLTAKFARHRLFQLDSGMGMGGGMGMMGGAMTINDQAFDMNRVDFSVQKGTFEKWTISPNVLSHPFHVHGVRFVVLAEGGRPPSVENRGWRDTVLVREKTDILIEFTQTAQQQKPFMFHCHILEHEDAGMMGQFAVT